MKKRNIIIGFLMLGSLFTFTSCVSKKPANTGSKPTQTEPTTPSPTTPSPTTPSPTTPSPTTPSPTTPGTSTPEPTVPSEPTTNPEPVEEKYTVNFVTNCEITIEAQKIEDGEKIQTIPNLTKTGYKFAGWYLDEEFTLSFDITNDVVTSEITLYAKWEKEEYTIVFNTLGGNTINSVKVKYQDTLTQPANPTKLGYIFDGWYTDNACTNVYDFDAQVTSGFTLYAKWREKSKYDELLEKADALVLNNDFNSYGATDTLATYSGTWGTKGIYQYINEKLGVGTADPTANKVILGAGNAELYDNSGNGTQLVLDFGGLSGGIVEGYLETTLIDQGNSWTFFQLYGKEGAEVVEVFGIRIESGVLKYRLDGAVANPLNTITAANTTYKIYYKVNLDTKELTMTINEIEFASVTISKSELVGLKLVSSDNNNRRMKVDNVVVINENYSLPELKNILKARLATLKDDYVASYPTADLSSALTNGQAAIDAAETVASAYQAYDNAKAAMDVIVLSIYKEQKKAELDTYVDSSKYTENATALAKAIEDGKAAIDAAITTEAISNAVIAAKTAIDAIESDEVILAKAKETAVAELEAYKAGQFTVNEAAYQVALTNGENVINAATTKAAVASALASAKEAIDAIKTDAEETAAKRAAAIEEITTYATTKKNEINDTDEATTYQAKIDNEVTLGTASINAAEYAAIDNAVVIIKQKIDNLVSAAKETLADLKTSTIENLNNYVNSLTYDDTDLLNSINEVKTDTLTKINAATTKDDVLSHYNTAIASIEALIADYESTSTNSIFKQGDVQVTAFSGLSESAYFEFQAVSSASDYALYIKGGSYSTFTKLTDKVAYLRKTSTSTYRADLIGLKAGNYQVKIVPIISSAEKDDVATIAKVAVMAYDRSGYAHFNYNEGVGAYNDDGTLKDNAIVLYVTDENKNTVSLTYGGVTVTGVGNILNSVGQDVGGGLTNKGGKANSNQGILKLLAQNNVPLVVRLVGVVSNTGLYDKGTFAASSTPLINGLTIYDSLDNGGSVGDNGHMARMKSAKNVTIEGIGSDATVDGWGFHFMCETSAPDLGKSFEVRNLKFINTPEDAIGMEGTQGTLKADGTVENASSATADILGSVERCWIHNNEFYSPKISSPAESDKSEGDGSVDFKRGQYFTCSYNYFEGCHKTNLVGSADTSLQFNLTYHHNYWYLCKARGPLARRANIHMYNNVFDSQTDYAQNTRADAYIYSEYNLFYMTKNPQRVDGGAIKSYNDSFSSCIESMGGTIVTDKSQTVSNNCKFAYRNIDYSKFDTDSSLSYIANGDYYLQTDLTDARKVIRAQAGVAKDRYIDSETVTMDEISYISGKTVNATVETLPSTITPGKISKTPYIFELKKYATATVDYTGGVLLNEAGVCMLNGSGEVILAPGKYILQAMNIQAGDSGSLSPAIIKDSTCNSISFVAYDSEEFNNQLKADFLTAQNAIPTTITYTDECYSLVKVALDKYNLLSADLKAEVDATKTTNAYSQLKNLGIAKVESLISAIGTVGASSGTSISTARAAYNTLVSRFASVNVSNYATLVAAENAFASYAVQSCIDKIAAIGTVTLSSGDAITLARNEYDALDDEQKTSITNYATLVAAETEYARLVSISELDTLINDTSLNDLEGCAEVISRYNSLDSASQALINNTEKLSQIKIAYVELSIDSLPSTVTRADKAKVEEIRSAYDALSSTEKTLVTNLAKLTAAEEVINSLPSELTTTSSDFSTGWTITGANTSTAFNGSAYSGNTITAISTAKYNDIQSVSVKISSEDKGTTLFNVYYSEDGTTWTLITSFKNGSNNTDQTYSYDLSTPVSGYVKVECTCSKSSAKAVSCTNITLKHYA
ncbi:MAG: InlB B-repeat-containing protein [Anaeroplasma sp.]